MEKSGHSAELIMHPQAQAQARPDDERWPLPMATLFVVGASGVMWGGIYSIARAIFG